MRGIKVKTMRAIARQTQIAVLNYFVKTHRVEVENPAFGVIPTEPPTIEVKRYQLLLGNCQRRMVQKLKQKCPKNGFFLGMSVRAYRKGDTSNSNMIVQLVEAPQ